MIYSINNTKVEEYWTWKMNNIIFSWIDSIVSMISLIINIFVEAFAIIYMFILVFTKSPNIYFSLWFIILFTLVIYLFVKWLLEITKIRKQAKELNIQIDGNKVKVLMSKYEIQQNHKIEYETDKIWNYYNELKKLLWVWNIKKSLRWNWAQSILKSLYVIIFFVVWIWVINWYYSIATITLFIWILDIISKYAWQIRGYMRDILKYFIDIEKLIEIFEIIPRYKDDSNLPDLIYKKWDINFKNISFWYNK